jgi:hypothetical protein
MKNLTFVFLCSVRRFEFLILIYQVNYSPILKIYMMGGKGNSVEGLPSKEELMKEYWKSMIPLSDYFKHKPFNNPEVYIFEQVRARIIEFME